MIHNIKWFKLPSLTTNHALGTTKNTDNSRWCSTITQSRETLYLLGFPLALPCPWTCRAALLCWFQVWWCHCDVLQCPSKIVELVVCRQESAQKNSTITEKSKLTQSPKPYICMEWTAWALHAMDLSITITITGLKTVNPCIHVLNGFPAINQYRKAMASVKSSPRTTFYTYKNKQILNELKTLMWMLKTVAVSNQVTEVLTPWVKIAGLPDSNISSSSVSVVVFPAELITLNKRS